MKNCYRCETCGRVFENEEECIACENKHNIENERKENLRKNREKRWQEVIEAYQNADKLLNKFNDDYNNNVSCKDSPIDLFEWMISRI